MPLLGLYFGMAATVTPLAFIVTIAIYCLINRKNLTRPPLWFFTGLIGVVTGFLICWLVGSGIDHYTSSQATTFDYVSLSNLFSDPFTAIPKILWHIIYNFGIVFLPLLGLFIVCLIFKKHNIKFQKLNIENKNLILVFVIFIVIHLLGASLIKAPFRLLIPAYLAGIIITFRFFASAISSKFIGTTIVIFTVLILFIHTFLLVKYRAQVANLLTEIKNSTEPSLCIEKSRTTPTRLHFIDLSQANFLVDWGSPELIYDKNVTFCK
jgi:hypothetical protein